jgi:hypothetical protein
LVPQVSVELPLQRSAPGAHTPPHLPVVALHMLGHDAAAPYVPLAPQCLEAGPLVHVSLAGTHSPEQRPVAPSQTKAHAVAWSSIQTLLALHVCGLPALHCF